MNQLSDIKFLNYIKIEMQDQYKNISDKQLLYQILRNSMSKMINDIYNTTSSDLKNKSNNIKDIQNNNSFTVRFSANMQSNCNTIKDFLTTFVYNHKKLLDKKIYSKNVVKKLFSYFKKNNNNLPIDWRKQEIEIERLICDYISGMTDRFALNLYKEIYG